MSSKKASPSGRNATRTKAIQAPKRAAVMIGINKAGHLPTLNAAVEARRRWESGRSRKSFLSR